MKGGMLAAAVAAFAAVQSAAVTVGPEWCVAYPESGSKDVNRILKFAAEEVRDDINEATGLKLKALPASKAKAPAIYIGAEFAKSAGFDLPDLKWYDNVVAEKGGSIYLFGNDRPGRDTEKFGRIGWFHCVLPSVKAATRFLETSAGVRFLLPGKVGTEVPRRKEVSLADGSVSKERPRLIYANGRGGNDGMMYRIANGFWGMGAFHTYGGHSYPSACSARKYIGTHPEYIGMKNGKRIINRDDSLTPLCISNPAVEDLMVEELKRQFDMGADVCQLGQNDGMEVCGCDSCRALYGTGDDWCEKFWLFHRHIAERMLKERPGKIVHILCYAMTVHPPKTFKEFPSNVMIEMCKSSEQAFGEWKGYTVPHGFTVYTYLTGAYVLPGFVARHSFAYYATLAKRFRDNGVRGVYRCGAEAGDLFGTEGPGYYVFNKLLLDGSLNVNALVTDYCQAAFGPASEQMKRFYDTQDARLRMFDAISGGFSPDAASGLDGYLNATPKNPLDLHGWMFSPDTTARMEEFLARAEGMEGLSAKHRKRLELVRLEFDYAKMMGSISTLYSAYKLRPSKESIEPLLDEVGRRDAYIKRICAGGRSPKRLDGWPEIQPFGHSCTLDRMKVNGILGAPIGAPLTWPVEDLRATGMLPGLVRKEAYAVRASGAPSFSEFKSGDGWNDMGGMSLERVPLKARFKAMYDNDNLYVLSECDHADGVAFKSFPHDGPVWGDDCVDMMVAPGDSRDVVYHLIWNFDPSSRYDNATGLIKDMLDPSYGKADVSWNGKGWRTESRQEGGKWRSIATIPYSDFGVSAPKAGDKWFINVGFASVSGSRKEDCLMMLWSPNVESRNMAAPNAMGRLAFR